MPNLWYLQLCWFEPQKLQFIPQVVADCCEERPTCIEAEKNTLVTEFYNRRSQ
jgi:hypothetical protein